MTAIWTRQADGAWHAESTETHSDSAASARPFRLAIFGHGSDCGMALLSSPGVQTWVNGRSVIAGLKVLTHKDEIQVGEASWYYSSESAPSVIEFQLPDGQRRPRCGVCRAAIQDGDASVECPRCHRVYHQIDAADERSEKHCFTYRDHCLCGHPTSLSGEAVWRPDMEEQSSDQ